VSRVVICGCGKWVFVHNELTERTVACPTCGAKLAVSIGENTPDPNSVLSRTLGARRSADADAPAWVTTRKGLSVAFYALLVAAIATTVFALCMVTAIAVPDVAAKVLAGEPGTWALVIWPVGSLLALGGAAVAMIVGWILCCNVPQHTGGRLPLYAALASVWALLLVVLAQVSLSKPWNAPPARAHPVQAQGPFWSRAGQSAEPAPIELRICSWISTLLTIASPAFFALFLGAVGKTKGRHDISGWVVAFVSFQCIAAILATVFCLGAVPPLSPEMAKTLLGPLLAANLLSDLCLLHIVHQVRAAIRR